MSNDTYMNFLIDSIIGTRDHLKRMCEVKGAPLSLKKELDEKIEVIIELSGKLGRTFQRDKDMQELREMKIELHKYKSGMM